MISCPKPTSSPAIEAAREEIHVYGGGLPKDKWKAPLLNDLLDCLVLAVQNELLLPVLPTELEALARGLRQTIVQSRRGVISWEHIGEADKEDWFRLARRITDDRKLIDVQLVIDAVNGAKREIGEEWAENLEAISHTLEREHPLADTTASLLRIHANAIRARFSEKHRDCLAKVRG
jgi:hypothetical protein